MRVKKWCRQPLPEPREEAVPCPWKRAQELPCPSRRETLKVERVFSDAKKTAVRPDRMGYAHRRNHRRLRQGDFPAGECRGAQVLVAAGHQGRGRKYFYGEQNTAERETSVRQLIHRVTRTIADWGVKDGYFTKADGEVFYDDLTWLCLNQYGAFNSPVWFNVGLLSPIRHRQGTPARATGICNRKTGRGRARRDPVRVSRRAAPASSSRSTTTWRTSCSLAHSEAMLFKYRLRHRHRTSPRCAPRREKLSGGGRPSGPLSFLKVYDQVANVVKCGGKTRRAAKMNTLKDWHRRHRGVHRGQDEGGEEGLGADRAGLRRQLQRRCLRLGDVPEREPLRARQRRVHAGRRRRQGVVDPHASPTASRCEKKDARELLRKIAEGTWVCGDPGHAVRHHHPQVAHLQGHRAAELHQPVLGIPLPRQHRLQPRLAEPDEVQDARTAAFDVERFKAAVRIFITAQEILVDNASYPDQGDRRELPHLPHPRSRLRQPRRAHHELRAAPTTRDEGRALAGAITAIMTGHAYEQSAEIAADHRALPRLPRRPLRRCDETAATRTTSSPCSRSSSCTARRSRRSSRASEFGYLKDEARKCWDARPATRAGSTATATPRSPCSRPPARSAS